MQNAKIRIYISLNGAHFTMWDDAENYFKALNGFYEMLRGNRLNLERQNE